MTLIERWRAAKCHLVIGLKLLCGVISTLGSFKKEFADLDGAWAVYSIRYGRDGKFYTIYWTSEAKTITTERTLGRPSPSTSSAA